MTQPRFRRSYAEDSTLGDRVFDLLKTWLPGLPEHRRQTALLGSGWEACSIPFVHEVDGRVVSHVGLVELPYVINGELTRVGGIHGVCTLASERRRGHFRRIMDELLDYCEGRYATLELGSENPEFYQPFGFRIVPEHRFIAEVSRAPGRAGFRPFDPSGSGDLGALDRLLKTRAPVSQRIGIVEDVDVFKFSQGTDGLHYCEALDCFAVFDIEKGRLDLLDVVASEIPALDALLAQIPVPIERVAFHFCPDRFDVETRPEIFRYDGDHYMVRGPFALEGELFMIPPPARH